MKTVIRGKFLRADNYISIFFQFIFNFSLPGHKRRLVLPALVLVIGLMLYDGVLGRDIQASPSI